MKILEVYLRSEEKPRPPPGGSYSDYDAHPCQAKHNIVKTFSRTDSVALESLKREAAKVGVTVKVYDVATLGGRLKAFARGVKTVPTTVVGERRMSGIPSSEELQRLV